MTRIGFTLQVHPEKVEMYKQHHREVWPELQTALSAAGWHNYSLFIRPDARGDILGKISTVQTTMAFSYPQHRYRAAQLERLSFCSLALYPIYRLEPF